MNADTRLVELLQYCQNIRERLELHVGPIPVAVVNGLRVSGARVRAGDGRHSGRRSASMS